MSLTPPPSAPFLYELRPADARKVLDNLRAARSASYRSTRRGATVAAPVGDVQVCVSCGSSRLIKWGGYRRWLRQRLEVSCVWVPRRRCTGCGKTSRPTPIRRTGASPRWRRDDRKGGGRQDQRCVHSGRCSRTGPASDDRPRLAAPASRTRA